MNDTDLLNGRRFVMISSTASAVDADAPTEFAYEESGGVIWGHYTGDTVIHGRFVAPGTPTASSCPTSIC